MHEVAIGLDVGTSCTKMVLRDIPTGEAFAVPLGELCGAAHNYLLPTAVGLSKAGAFRLGRPGKSFRDPKMEFVMKGDELYSDSDGFPPFTPLEAFAAFIGIVLSIGRGWLLETQENRYKDLSIVWHLNIGIPSNVLDAKTLEDGFKIAALAGWSVSTLSEEPSLSEVREGIKSALVALQHKPKDLHETGIIPSLVNAYPEVIAEVQGYSASSRRQVGLHFLIDVGASTVDLVTFNLVGQGGGTRYPIWAADVYTMGVLRINEDRIRAVNAKMKEIGFPSPERREWLRETEQKIHNGLRSADLVDNLPGDLADSTRDVDDAYMRRIRRAMGNIVRITKKSKDPKSPAWQDGLPLFVCGGGGEDPVICRSIEKFDKSFYRDDRGLFRRIELARPEEFNAPGLAPNEFHRLAVADGLAHRGMDIGAIISPELIEDVPSTVGTIDIGDRFIGKDQV